MKNFLYFLITCFVSHNILNGQAPAIEWENTIGGNASDALTSIKQTFDGGYIIGGSSNSDISGDKAEDNCGEFSNGADFWIMKLNDDGNIQWQNTIGGSSEEEHCFIFQTVSGDFIAAGSSGSSKECDKTSNNYGGQDYWVIKLNTSGVLLWQMKIGGEGHDMLASLEPTADGGFILGGYSSTAGLGGNKTEAGMGLYDYYIVKISPTGSIEWQNTIGTTADDYLTSLKPCADGGYIVGGHTTGGISGDKTEGSMSPGYSDYWVMKLDASGNIQWQNTIGGNFIDLLTTVLPTTDGGFLIGGVSDSGISGDKTESSIGYSRPWILKLNTSGIIEWQNTINDGPNSLTDMIYTSDGNYLLAGGAFWISKLNPLGGELWSETIGSGYNPVIEQTADLGYIIAGSSNYGITDVKSEPNYGDSDYWVIKLEPDVCLPVDEICNGLDDNCNGIADDDVVETISINPDGATTFCKGEEVTLEAVYTGTSLQWKKDGFNIPGATSSTYIAELSGDYGCLTSSDCGSAMSEIITVTTLKKPSAFIYPDGPTYFCTGSSVTLIANTGGGLTYQWYNGATPIAGATSPTYVATTTGNYKCQVTKATSGCSKQSNSIAVSVPCREDDNKQSSIVISPSPASNFINIQTENEIEQKVSVFDNSGSQVKEMTSNLSQFVIDISDFPCGLYYLQITTKDKLEVVTFIKN